MIATKLVSAVAAIAIGAGGVAPWYDRIFPVEIGAARLATPVVAAGDLIELVLSYDRVRQCPVTLRTTIRDSQGLEFIVSESTPIAGPLGPVSTRMSQRLPVTLSEGRAVYTLTISATDCDNWTMRVWPLANQAISLPVFVQPAGTEVTPALFNERLDVPSDGLAVGVRNYNSVRSADSVGALAPDSALVFVPF